MARVATHLSVSELARHYRAAKDATAARHYQVIWLLAQGHTVPEVAAWMAGALGREKVAPQRGWEALRAIGRTIQVPRPRHPQAATAEEREAFKINSPRRSRRKPSATRRSPSRSSPATSTGSV